MKTFTIKAYRRKDDFVMLYVNNNANKVSLGISEDVKTSKISAEQKKLYAKLERAIFEAAPIVSNFKSDSQTSVLDSGRMKFFAVDNCKIDDLSLESDGGYILTPDGRLLSLTEIESRMNELERAS